MKTSLSHVLPVWKACKILGEPTVRRIVQTLMQLRTRGVHVTANVTHVESSDQHDTTNSETKTSQEELWDEELEQLVEALLYMPNQLPHGATPPVRRTNVPTQKPVTIPTPPVVAQSWQKLTTHTRMFGMDKSLLFRFTVPNVCQPHSGPQGHMGLFDCWVYTLQGHAPTSSATYYGGAANNMVWIPDVIIFLAVCKDYQDKFYSAAATTATTTSRPKRDSEMTEGTEEEDEEDEEESEDDEEEKAEEQRRQQMLESCLKTMAKLSYRFYDAYQKKGSLSRDTVHRFLTDVYGEDSYKTQEMRTLLDKVFRPTDKAISATAAAAGETTVRPQSSVQLSEGLFVSRIVATTPTLDAQRVVQKPHAPQTSNGHVLLDWISLLGAAMVPPEELPQSTVAYLETMQVHPQPIVHQYLLAETRLYEIKRRFHSLVESSAVIIHGDVMAANGDDNNEEEKTVDAGTKVANTSTNTAAPAVPKHVITQSAFESAVTRPNNDMGQGGYLPARLARMVFSAVLMGGSTAVLVDAANDIDDDDDGDPSNHRKSSKKKSFWGLYHVLKFGCEAVRCTKEAKTHKGKSKKISTHDRDVAILKQVFAMFAQVPTTSSNNGAKVKKPKDPLDGRLLLDRSHIGAMILLLLEHAQFRLQQDAPPQKDDDNTVTGYEDEETLDASDDVYVNASACSFLGLLPPTNQPPAPTEQVSLKDLVEYVLQQAKDKNSNKEDEGKISFEEFCRWHYASSDGSNAKNDEKQKIVTASQTRRLGPLLLELRLIAAVLFGIPPALASMEVTLIAELQRRHKYRYPPTEVSRRGPKGTVWYIIDHGWFQTWASLVKRVSHTVDDAGDGRSDGTATTSRGLPKINNTNLLADNGSLALRADIKWGHEYEILPPLAYSALQAWYDGGPPIHRIVVPYIPANIASPHSRRQPKMRTEMEMELYPFFVTVFLCDAASRGDTRPFQQYVPVSRVSPVRVVLLQLAKGLNIDPDLCRLWMTGTEPDSTDDNADVDWLLDLDKNIVEQRKARAQTHPGAASAAGGEGGGITLLLEVRDEESDMWPRGIDGRRRSYLDNRGQQRADEPEMGDGVVGLYNMGNTCYLNSSIQCLSHTPILREYFTSKAYLNDINTTNPLGKQGQLAQVSAVLINSLWKRFGNQMSSVASSSYNPRQPRRVTAPGSYCPVNAPSLTPKTFKESLGKFNEIFSGNEQHDAQELLAFLLDGLSEDLNRIMDKPYIEQPDSDGRPDSELADIWWSNHLKREMSIIVALFTGQYKSLLTCRSCKYESARFEPFMFLQLPLPEDDHVPVSVIMYPLSTFDAGGNPNPPKDVFKYSVRVRNDGNLYDVLVALAKLLHADETNKAAENDKNNSDRQRELQRLTSTATEDIEILEEVYQKRAKDMAVVDMRDGYISKVASNSWSLPDLQNKDTGELPVLHVYELDPLPEDNTDAMNESLRTGDLGKDDDGIKVIKASNNDEDESGEDDTSREEEEDAVPEPEAAKFSFLAMAQRKSEVMSRDFLHPLAHRVFGTPMLLRVQDLEGFTGRDLYDLVAVRVRTFVPKGALRFLEKDDDEMEVELVSSRQQSDGTQGSGRQRLKKTTTDMEEVSAGPVPRYGFRLRITSRDGRRCTLCPWFECCIGCLVPDDDYPTIVMCGDSITVDWHFAVDVATSGFGQRINSQIDPLVGSSNFAPRRNIPGVTIKNHSSMGAGPKKTGIQGAISLEDCLDSFAQEERIPEAYCSKCKDFRVQTKRMSLWRLPPIVIIQLKRFQFTQHMRRKLRDLVVFPVEGLDLSRIIASDNLVPPVESSNSSNQPKKKKKAKDKKKQSRANGSSKPAPDVHGSAYLEDPDIDDLGTEATESSQFITDDDGRSEMLYDLYGVVHHQGALSGGHYVASLKSELDGQWRLFNDAQIYEIHNRDVVDSSAYILFYIRRDVKDARLSDYWDTTAREGEGMSEEDLDRMLKGQRGAGASANCVIS
ncbi:Putative ubiquitin carboxyl-terminal hydrolase 11 [Seminavis robusta]|uniref:ubiquitinyl hydrolase 1 n=1 Tax=Seminavis robusta TaxID=568900 RepID=A0A9N8HHQ1_9STRA|nr:Putative ubiquitin carboxyl-terminal hydrolase 11 [Seminavis robusta]|eukprot:Sro460_g147410.1 Putative ubiquitin carboxyl-terminal hydrolase 11 (1967) ;mRNA; f:7254-13413